MSVVQKGIENAIYGLMNIRLIVSSEPQTALGKRKKQRQLGLAYVYGK